MNIFVAALSFAVVVCSAAQGSSDSGEFEIGCARENTLLRAFASRDPFMASRIGPMCTDMGKPMCGEECESIDFSPMEDNSLNATCPDEDHVMRKFTVCFPEGKMTKITAHCSKLQDKNLMGDRWTVNSDSWGHSAVDCGYGGVIQGVQFTCISEGLYAATLICVEITKD